MAVFKPLVLDKEETDIKTVMSKLYRFCEELKYTIENLSLEDNIGKGTLDVLAERQGITREITFNTDEFRISFESETENMRTALSQSQEKISLLVEKGGVVDTMLTRMELYGEFISLKTGQIIIQANNMALDKNGNADFSGTINGGAINIQNKFVVTPAGPCYIDGTLRTATLNPNNGVYANELEIYNDSDYVNNVTGNMTCSEAYVSDTLNCRKVYQTSDRRLKQDIERIEPAKAAEALAAFRPVSFSFKGSGRSAVGYIAQEVYKGQERLDNLPLVRRRGRYLELSYDSYGALYAAAIQHNQMRIERISAALKRMGGKGNVKL